MKGKIDNDGHFLLECAGQMKIQQCCFRDQPCGDHCPMFSEPEKYGEKSIELTICKNNFTFADSDFIDERDIENLSRAELVKLLANNGNDDFSESSLETMISAGAPVNPDGTINLKRFTSWCFDVRHKS